MTETPFFLDAGDHQLFAVAHDPAGPASGQAFVFCHPLAEEKLWTHRVFVGFARQLARGGHAAFRFDMTGNGDSDGGFEACSVERMLDDVRAAVRETRRRWPGVRVTLIGLRFGATIAALAAERDPDIDRLVLWAPLVDGERYMQELLRTNLATQTAVYREVRFDRTELAEQMRNGATVNVDGYAMAYPLFSQASAIKLADSPKTYAGPCLVVQVDRMPGKPAPDLQQLAGRYPRATLEFAQEEPFWREIQKSYLREAPNLFAVTAAWLASPTERSSA